MAMPLKKFTASGFRFNAGFKENFDVSEKGLLVCNKNENRHIFISTAFDSAEKECDWGRLRIAGKISEESQTTIIAFADDSKEILTDLGVEKYSDIFANKNISSREKINLIKSRNHEVIRNSNEGLLYKLKGRYLWFCIEIIGGECDEISSVELYATKQSFIDSFPEIYRKDSEFFERYLSIFSTMFTDLQMKIDTLPNYIDIDTAPDDILPIFASWLGMDVKGNFLEAKQLRQLIKNGYAINRIKGTRAAILEVSKIMLEDEPIIVEQRAVNDGASYQDSKIYCALYGENPYGFTILVDREPNEKFHSQFSFIINQFKPARTKVNIVFLRGRGQLDTHCYLDINAKIIQNTVGILDNTSTLSSNIILS